MAQPIVDSLVSLSVASIAVGVVHNPLAMHRFARRAAHAVECLARDGEFGEALRAGYRWQDSLGVTSWWELARRSGARDSAAFVACLEDPAISSVIDRGRSAANRLGIQETPVVVAGGWRLRETPSVDAIQRALARR
jgi:protein-disulfide isomerase